MGSVVGNNKSPGVRRPRQWPFEEEEAGGVT